MSTHHTHDHDATADHDAPTDPAERFSQASWDARYSSSNRLWSGEPNPRLVEHVTGLRVGDALDVGAGEGADAVWLARQGWQVTALDVSPVALARTGEHADEAGVADRVTPLQHDLMAERPIPGQYDLVSAQYWHPPIEQRDEFATVIGAAVRRGGTLLVVGHHPAHLPPGMPDPHGHGALMFTPEDITEHLPATDWDVRVAATATRMKDGPDGPVEAFDSVVLAVRR